MDGSEGPPRQQIAAAVRRERLRVGLSLTQLARRAGIAPSTLSQLEAGTGNPGLETLWAISVQLDVPVSWLLDPPRAGSTVLRRGEGVSLPAEAADYVATLLSPSPAGARRDLYLVQVEPGSARLSPPHQPGTLEHVVLGSGRAAVGPETAVVELEPGDYVAYPGDVAHVFRALAPGTVAVVTMEHAPGPR